MKVAKYIISLFVLVSAFVPGAAFGLGQVTEPIMISAALRGESFQESVFIVNNQAGEGVVELSAEGEIAEWVKFYAPDDSEHNIATIIVPATSNKEVFAVFTIPADLANGDYSGFVSVTQKPADEESSEGSQSMVSQKIDREVYITVSDNENVNFDVSVIPEVYDLDKGQNLKVRFIYDNRGNISLAPQISLKIENLDGQTVYNAIYPYPEDEAKVKPGERHEIPTLEIPTSNLNYGKYFAKFSFLYDNEVRLEKDFRFSVRSRNGIVFGVFTSNYGIFWPLVIALAVIVAAVFIVRGVIKKKAAKV